MHTCLLHKSKSVLLRQSLAALPQVLFTGIGRTHIALRVYRNILPKNSFKVTRSHQEKPNTLFSWSWKVITRPARLSGP